MQSSQAHAVSFLQRYRKELEKDAPEQQIVLDRDIIERAAQALFECVFSCCGRLDGKHRWTNCDENTKEGFRGEAIAVIEAVWPLLFRGEVHVGLTATNGGLYPFKPRP